MAGYSGIEIDAPESVEFSTAVGKFLMNFGVLEFFTYEIIRIISRKQEVYESYLGASFGRRLTYIKDCIYQEDFSKEQKKYFEEAIESARVMADVRAWVAHNPVCLGEEVEENGNKVTYIKIMKMNAPRNAVPGMNIEQLNKGVDLVHELAHDFDVMYQAVVAICALRESSINLSP